jgi:hypothetical protein
MIAFVALLRCELQLRGRRVATLVVLLAVVAASWLMLADPAGGYALMVVDDHRMRYSSETLAFGSASLGAVLLTLAGFYLVRGRMQEDLRSGMAGVLAASPVSSTSLLLARWLGGTTYLLLLALALLGSTLVLHLLRGEGPLQLFVYLRAYVLTFVPAMMFTAAAALLADAWSPLMGRRGDVVYFAFWTVLLAVFPAQGVHAQGQLAPWMVLDVTGLVAGVVRLSALMHSGNIGIGGSDFKADLPLLDFPPAYWTLQMIALRLASGLLPLLPLGLALLAFHRWAPDRVKPVRRAGRSPRSLSRWLALAVSPATRALGALLPLAARLPAGMADVAAELLVSLITQPLAVVWLLLAWIGPLLAPADALLAWQAAIALGWGLWASELGARHAQASFSGLGAALRGGTLRRYASCWGAAWLLGLLANAGVAAVQPGTVAPFLVGYALLAAGAQLLGLLSRGGRSFLALFMFWLLVAVQAPEAPWVDLLGFNERPAVAAQAVATALLLAAGLAISRMRPR